MYNMQISNMDAENEIFMKRWKEDDKKEHVRVTLSKEAADFATERAPEFGVGQSSLSLEISKLILIAKKAITESEKLE